MTGAVATVGEGGTDPKPDPDKSELLELILFGGPFSTLPTAIAGLESRSSDELEAKCAIFDEEGRGGTGGGEDDVGDGGEYNDAREGFLEGYGDIFPNDAGEFAGARG